MDDFEIKMELGGDGVIAGDNDDWQSGVGLHAQVIQLLMNS
jgi:hypothetical protein